MKKTLSIVLLIFIFLTGCSSKDDSSTNTKDIDLITEQAKENEDKILKELESLKQKDTKPNEISLFLDTHISSLSPSNADILISTLEEIQDSNLEYYLTKFEDEENLRIIESTFTTYPFKKSDYEHIENPELKSLMKEIFEGGYKLETEEGFIYLIVDYEEFKKYFPYLSQELRDYIDIKSSESNELSSRDAGLSITWDELANRLSKTENFLVNHPNSSKKESIGRLYQFYIYDYFIGLDNTPAFDYETQNIDPELLKSYQNSLKLYDKMLFTQILSEYIKELEANNFKKNDQSSEKIDSLIHKNLEYFKIQ